MIGDAQYAFAIETRVGAHVFSLTFQNGPGTTFRQIAHGGVPEHLTLGFNLDPEVLLIVVYEKELIR